MRYGVLALQGAVSEHVSTLEEAIKKLGISAEVLCVREKEELKGLDGIILPGGESTTLSLLLEAEDMFEELGNIPKILGTCAGAILLAREIEGVVDCQKCLGKIDMKISRNSYGRQLDSFEVPLETSLGKINGVFIRAPGILEIGPEVKVLAEYTGNPVAVQQGKFMATAFHPELSGSTVFHEHFLKL